MVVQEAPPGLSEGSEGGEVSPAAGVEDISPFLDAPSGLAVLGLWLMMVGPRRDRLSVPVHGLADGDGDAMLLPLLRMARQHHGVPAKWFWNQVEPRRRPLSSEGECTD